MSPVVAAARAWLETPYLHQGRACGQGADCLGLICGVARDLGTALPEYPTYSEMWFCFAESEPLLRGIERHFEPASEHLTEGDILAFRIGRERPVRHLGILSAVTPVPRFIHVLSGYHVAEVSFGPAWQRRLAARFRFPNT